MIEFLFTFIIFLAIMAAMAVGVFRGRAPISGSCGGLANLGVDGACEICGGNPSLCEAQSSGSPDNKVSFYEADQAPK